jgi:hypothetical protein
MRRGLLRAISAFAASPATAGPAQARHPKESVRHSGYTAELEQDRRKLWTDHVVWTRDYIIAAVGDHPDATTAAN